MLIRHEYWLATDGDFFVTNYVKFPLKGYLTKLRWSAGVELGPTGLTPRGEDLYFRLDIILVKGLSKHTLNIYFSGMKIDPKYTLLHAFFLICPSYRTVISFPKFVKMTKNTPFFFNFARFKCTPKRCTRVHCLVLKSNPKYHDYVNCLRFVQNVVASCVCTCKTKYIFS